eukprot:Skav217389  [mRNA]  locus=scaffold532:132571:134771:- [translate_table: standard]
MANFRYLFTFIDEQSHGEFLARSKSWPQLGGLGRAKSMEEEEAKVSAYVEELQNRCILTFGQQTHPQPEPPEVLGEALNEVAEAQLPVLPNPGSYGHPALCHRPCVRFAKGTCEMGDECSYCHLAGHSRSVHPDKRQRGQLQKMATWRHLIYRCEARGSGVREGSRGGRQPPPHLQTDAAGNTSRQLHYRGQNQRVLWNLAERSNRGAPLPDVTELRISESGAGSSPVS